MGSLPIKNTSLKCSIDGCSDNRAVREWCKKHYSRWRTYGHPLVTKRNMDSDRPCLVPDCGVPQKTKGYCAEHYQPRQAGGRGSGTCRFKGCGNATPTGMPLCPKHYQRLRQGRPMSPTRERGDGWYKDGYIFHQVGDKAVAQHRLVMERMIGRELLPEETVHHMNGVRHDNRPENLELWSCSQPSSQRVVDKLAWAREIIALYEPLSFKIESLRAARGTG